MPVVRYFAGARVAAGSSEEKVEASTLGELLATVGADRPRLAEVLRGCSFLVDGLAWKDRSAALPESATVDVLPPFAGG
jgi:molybdopterin synthase sulfur carrier subunit